MWALFTTCFVHIEPLHLLFNVYWMWTLGQVVERELGLAVTLGLFVAAGVVSSAAELAGSGSTGIGLSGLLYALFGFLWAARTKVPAFGTFLTRELVQWFLAWLVLCFVVTWAGSWNVGNYAHLGGLLFGYGVAAAWTFARGRRVALVGTVLASSTRRSPPRGASFAKPSPSRSGPSRPPLVRTPARSWPWPKPVFARAIRNERWRSSKSGPSPRRSLRRATSRSAWSATKPRREAIDPAPRAP